MFLQKRILTIFGDKIAIKKCRNKNVVFCKNTTLTLGLLLNMANENNNQYNSQKAALHLRREILSVERRPLPENLDRSHILSGECDIPENLKTFLRYLLIGSKSKPENLKNIKIDSLAHDIIYNVTNGTVKPSKHLELGLTAKTLTGSKRVITLLNKFGHSISYSLAEELETEPTYSSLSTEGILPREVTCTENRVCALAFDGYDRYLEIQTGKNPLHDTVGIFYREDIEEANQTFKEMQFNHKKFILKGVDVSTRAQQ